MDCSKINLFDDNPNISNFEKLLYGRADNIISLEDMKKIMKESIDNAKTYGDYLNGMIIGAYKLGIEHGKVACQETIDILEKQILKKKVGMTRESNMRQSSSRR